MTAPARLLLLEGDFLSQRMAVAMLEGEGFEVDTKEAPGVLYDAVIRGVATPVDRDVLLAAVAALRSLPDGVLDLEIVEQLRLLGRDVDEVGFFPELVEQFVVDGDDRLAGVRAAASAVDFTTVSRLAHALKGAGGQLGGRRLADACTAMQEAAETGVPAAVDVAIADVGREYALLCAALTDEVARAR